MKRGSWDEHWMKQASVVAERGTCLRRNYGAIIVSQSNVLISQGYCGAPRGFPHCSEYGVCFRKEKNIVILVDNIFFRFKNAMCNVSVIESC